MAEDKVIGEMDARYRTEVRAEAPYIVVKQENPDTGDDEFISIHVNALQEFYALLSAASDAVKKEMQRVVDALNAS